MSIAEIFKKMLENSEEIEIFDENAITGIPCVIDSSEVIRDGTDYHLNFSYFTLTLNENAINNGSFSEGGSFNVKAIFRPYHEEEKDDTLDIEIEFSRLTRFKPSDIKD